MRLGSQAVPGAALSAISESRSRSTSSRAENGGAPALAGLQEAGDGNIIPNDRYNSK
jgi:hypothetical protein